MVKLMVIVVILAGVGLFFLKGPDGKPFLTVDDFAVELPDSPASMLPQQLQPEEPDTVTKIYKWKDEDGVWQFSNSPQDKEGSELIEFSAQTNIIQSYSPPPLTTVPPTKREASGGEVSTSDSIPGVMTVSPEQAAEMMKTVKNLQSTVDQRKADLDALSGVND